MISKNTPLQPPHAHGAKPSASSRATKPTTLVFLTASLFTLFSLASCSKPDTSQLSEWTPADHTSQKAAETGQVDTSKKRPGFEKMQESGINDVTLATWKQNCVRCHGVIGRGDGPESRVVRPPDFTNPKWQALLSDAQLRATIKSGKGKMPAFEHLPEETVTSLISLIRLLNSERHAPSADPQRSGKGSAKEQTVPTTAKTVEEKPTNP